MSAGTEIQKALFKARRETQEMRLKSLDMGIKKVEEIERKENDRLGVQERRQKEGADRAHRRAKSHKKINTEISGDDLQNAVHANHSTTAAETDAAKDDVIVLEDSSCFTPCIWYR